MEIKVNTAHAPAMREWLTARGLAFAEKHGWFSSTFSVSVQDSEEFRASLDQFHLERARDGAW